MFKEIFSSAKNLAERVAHSKKARVGLTALGVGGLILGGIESVDFDPHYYIGGTPRLNITSRFGKGLLFMDGGLFETTVDPCQWVGDVKDPNGIVFDKIDAVVRTTHERVIIPASESGKYDVTEFTPCQ